MSGAEIIRSPPLFYSEPKTLRGSIMNDQTQESQLCAKNLWELKQEINTLRQTVYNLRQELLQLKKQTQALRNCDNCNERGCHGAVDENIGIDCLNHDLYRWEHAQ